MSAAWRGEQHHAVCLGELGFGEQGGFASGGTGDEDEACCVAGIQAAGLTADANE